MVDRFTVLAQYVELTIFKIHFNGVIIIIIIILLFVHLFICLFATYGIQWIDFIHSCLLVWWLHYIWTFHIIMHKLYLLMIRVIYTYIYVYTHMIFYRLYRIDFPSDKNLQVFWLLIYLMLLYVVWCNFNVKLFIFVV